MQNENVFECTNAFFCLSLQPTPSNDATKKQTLFGLRLLWTFGTHMFSNWLEEELHRINYIHCIRVF